VRHEQVRLRELFREASAPQWLDAVEVEEAAAEPPAERGAPSAERGEPSAERGVSSAAASGSRRPTAGDRVRFDVGMSLEDLEREAIAGTLESVAGNRRRAADILGIGERTLYRKLKQYHIDQ
jgi:DNA-binding NtrC family response regulator